MKKSDKEQDIDIHLTCLFLFYQPAVFLSFCTFSGNLQAFLHSFLSSNRVSADRKCGVQRMPELFAERWALTLAFPAISFIHFKLIFIPADKVKLINQCPGFELDPVAFNLSQPRMLKLCAYLLGHIKVSILDSAVYQHCARFGVGRKVCLVATTLIKLLQHSMCVFTCLLRSHPSPHPPCVFIVARPFCPYFMLITPAKTLSPLHIL